MSRTLIIPCAGKSTRFPNMKPKWLLTHPDGKIMIEKAISGIDLTRFSDIIITTVKDMDEKYEVRNILSSVFEGNHKVRVCVLDQYTSSVGETICETIAKMNIIGGIVIKDSDNYVKAILPSDASNFIVGLDLNLNQGIANIPAKSFIIKNNQDIIVDIIEKKVVSNIICLGIYGFNDASEFMNAYEHIVDKGNPNIEMYISHVISYMISRGNVFKYNEAIEYEDWGTLDEWLEVQKRFRTYFVDVDGIIMKNSGKYGRINWNNNDETIAENIERLKVLQRDGAQLIITTSRTEEYRPGLENILKEAGLFPYAVLMGLNHAARVVINDFAPTNPFPSAISINIPRNGLISDYV